MSRRTESATSLAQSPQKSVHSRRLDYVLRAGAEKCNGTLNKAPTPEPTGVLGLLSLLPGTTPRRERYRLQGRHDNYETPAQKRIVEESGRGGVFPGPDEYKTPDYKGPSYPDQPPVYKGPLVREQVDGKAIKGLVANGTKHNGQYTGQLLNGKADGTGELILPSITVHDPEYSYNLSEDRVVQLLSEGAGDEDVRIARAEVEHRAQIPLTAYDDVWKSIKQFARDSKREVTINTLVKWAKDHRDKWYLFGAHDTLSLNMFRDSYLAPMVAAADQVSMVGNSLITDSVITTGEFKKFVDDFKSGVVHITSQRKRGSTGDSETRLWMVGTWDNGQLVDGAMSSETELVSSKLNVRIDVPIKATMNREGAVVNMGLRQETRKDGKLVHRIYVANIENGSENSILLSGAIMWSSRPTEMRFEWAGEAEMLKIKNGHGTLDQAYYNYMEGLGSLNPTLSGNAEVRLTIASTGEHVWLRGHMVENRLMGLVTPSGPIPNMVGLTEEDGSFYICSYDQHGRPVVGSSETSRCQQDTRRSRESTPQQTRTEEERRRVVEELCNLGDECQPEESPEWTEWNQFMKYWKYEEYDKEVKACRAKKCKERMPTTILMATLLTFLGIGSLKFAQYVNSWFEKKKNNKKKSAALRHLSKIRQLKDRGLASLKDVQDAQASVMLLYINEFHELEMTAEQRELLMSTIRIRTELVTRPPQD